MPYGGIDGTWGNRQLFTCAPKHGLLVPIAKIVPEYELFKWPCQEKRKLFYVNIIRFIHRITKYIVYSTSFVVLVISP